MLSFKTGGLATTRRHGTQQNLRQRTNHITWAGKNTNTAIFTRQRGAEAAWTGKQARTTRQNKAGQGNKARELPACAIENKRATKPRRGQDKGKQIHQHKIQHSSRPEDPPSQHQQRGNLGKPDHKNRLIFTPKPTTPRKRQPRRRQQTSRKVPGR